MKRWAVLLGLALLPLAQVPEAAASARPELIIHRAGFPDIDEEQQAGVRRSVHYGWGSEIDLRMTTDHRLVAVHDNTLKRISGGTSSIKPEEHTLAEVKAVTLVHGGHVQTFGQLMTTADNHDVKLLVELKQWTVYHDTWVSTGLGLVDEVLARHPGVVVWITGHPASVDPVHAAYPDWRLLRRLRTKDFADPRICHTLAAAGVRQVGFRWRDATQARVNECRDAGLAVSGRLTDDRDGVLRFKRLGVHRFGSNDPVLSLAWWNGTKTPTTLCPRPMPGTGC